MSTNNLAIRGVKDGGSLIASRYRAADKAHQVQVELVDSTGAAIGAAAPLATRSGVETTSTPAAVTLVASTAKALLAANASRIRATIYNPLATALYVRKAAHATSPATVSAGGYDFVIPPGGHWISDPYEYAGAFGGICATAGDVNVSEAV